MEEAETIVFGPGEEAQALSNAELKKVIQAEIDELRGFATLAESIKVNQKALRLFDAIDQGFERLREIGAPEKAIIFTDSTKTQEYIAQTLKDNGRGEGLVLFNGTNDSPEAKAIYKEWLEEHKDSDPALKIITLGFSLHDKLGLPVDMLNKEQSKFFKRHYKRDFRNMGTLVTEMEVIRRIEGW
jgi:ERCC4-related helicase